MYDDPKIFEFFDIKEYRPEQKEVFKSIATGGDVSVILRTGGGKSLLYQVPALYGPKDETTLVISPLLALQQDQIAGLSKKARDALFGRRVLTRRNALLLNHTVNSHWRNMALHRLERRDLKMLFLTPEQLRNSETDAALRKANIVRVVVDEAHVLPGYASGIRSAYGKIGEWIDTLPKRPQILTFSATVTKKNMAVIQESLGMKNATLHRFSIRRDNLNVIWKEVGKGGKDEEDKLNIYRFQGIQDYLEEWKQKEKKAKKSMLRKIASVIQEEHKEEIEAKKLKEIKNMKSSVVIYCATQKETEELGAWLVVRGWNVGIYHGDMENQDKIEQMNLFIKGDLPIMVATNAFGLGVDKGNISLVIHAYPPISLENYVQEIGRGGRDGREADCVMFYGESDWNMCKMILKHKNLEGLEALQEMVKKGKFRWKDVERYFGWKKTDLSQ